MKPMISNGTTSRSVKTWRNAAFRLRLSLIFDGRPRIEAVSRKSPPEELRLWAEVDGRVLFCVYVWRGEKRRVVSLRVAK